MMTPKDVAETLGYLVETSKTMGTAFIPFDDAEAFQQLCQEYGHKVEIHNAFDVRRGYVELSPKFFMARWRIKPPPKPPILDIDYW
jgi:hypothetical protein